MRKLALILSVLTISFIIATRFSSAGSSDQLSPYLSSCSGVVDKAPSGAFIVEIAFKNTGTTEGSWSVNIAFEGEKWNWSGTPQNMTLKPNHSKTLTWNGTVPASAPIDSVARLIVYYDDSYKPLDWWIHVVPGAELAITSNTVK
jgi:hypothetical protein